MTPVDPESRQYLYDAAGRLRRECVTAGTCAPANSTLWTYDQIGRRLTEKKGTAPVVTNTFDAADQLVSATNGTVTTAFGYNANGDQTLAGNVTSTFNTAHQTKTVTTPTGSVTYGYDGDGNRVIAGTRRFVWDRLSPTGVPDAIAELEGANVLNRYRYGPIGPAVMMLGGNIAWPLVDQVGTIRQLVQYGSTVAQYTTDAWGNRTTIGTPASGFTSNPLGYTGQYSDPLTGSLHLRARQYNPTFGTFTQTDPMPYGVGHPYESSYVYGFNNPNVFVDPSGLRGQVAGGLPSECFGMEARQIALDSIQAGSNLPGSVANGFISIGNWVNPFTDIPNVPKIRIDGACDIVSDLATGSVTFVASGGTKAIMAAPKIITGGAGAAKAAVALARNARAQSSAIYEISLAAKDIRHALKNHFVVKAGKSLFAPDANFLQLVRDAERVKPVTQTMNPNLIRVVKAAKAVGTEASTGQMTNVYTVVTRADGSLVTMYPGRP